MCRIELRNLDKVYTTGKVEYQALKDIDLTMRGGQVTAIVGPKGLARWDPDGNLLGSLYPAADGTWAIAWDGECIWTIQRTCEMWDDDKIFRIEVLDDSLE